MWDEYDSYCLIAGIPFRPKWKEAPFKRWFAWRPVRLAGGWAWWRMIERRRRYSYRWHITPFGPCKARTTDYREIKD